MATVASFIVWYIVDEKVPGVIVMTWVATVIGYYFLMKFPRFAVACMIAIITMIMIIGYELQVKVLGIQV